MTKFLAAAHSAGTSLVNESIADQVLNAADTYVAGSQLPLGKPDARTSLRWRLWLTKTGAGVAAPAFKVRVGEAGAIADTARVTFAGPAQTAVADVAYVEILLIFRANGAAAVLSGVLKMTHNLDSTGFAVTGTPTVIAASAAFDSSIADLIAGLSIDPGAAGVWTVSGVIAELVAT